MIYAFCKNIILSKKTYDWLDMSWVGDFNPQMMHIEGFIGAKQSHQYYTFVKVVPG